MISLLCGIKTKQMKWTNITKQKRVTDAAYKHVVARGVEVEEWEK